MLFPKEESNNSDNEFKRLIVKYVDKSKKFNFKQRDYSKQFSHLYSTRLEIMTKLLASRVKDKWGDEFPIKKLYELREETPDKCVLIGTLFKHQVLHPSILRDISEENQLAPQPQRFHFVDETDTLVLEDERQRIRLIGNMDVNQFVTGIVCAILGYEEGDGKYIVEDYIFYESGPQKSLKTIDESPLVVFISGLNQSSNNNFSMSLELLQQWVFGNLEGFGQSRDYEAASIVRIIVAGNSIRSSFETRNKQILTRRPESVDTIEAVKSLDSLLHNFSKTVNVDLMSGEFDPSNHMLPQQPMHNCMFPKCSQYKSFKGVTNPYECEIADRTILGTSGQNIQDISRYSNIEDPLESLRSTLIWGNIAPTSPDTLPCYPYLDEEPFIIRECPNIYFSGNCAEFKTDLHVGANGQKTRLICIPSFSDTQSVAVVNLRTLEAQKLSFRYNCFENMEE